MSCAPSQHTLTKDASLPFDAGRKLGIVEMASCGKCSRRTRSAQAVGGAKKSPEVGSR